jgi:hypothetical protein
MKSIYDYINEASLLDNVISEASLLDIEGTIENGEADIKKNLIKKIEKFIKDNYSPCNFTISDKPNKDGLYEVDADNVIVRIWSATNKKFISLTNGVFTWNNIDGYFDCNGSYITSLKGSPKKVGGYFDCNSCRNLKDLKGAPEFVGGNFICEMCNNLLSLEGAPKTVEGDFNCRYCKSLKSLKGAPKNIGKGFICYSCAKTFRRDYIEKLSKIKGLIFNI